MANTELKTDEAAEARSHAKRPAMLYVHRTWTSVILPFCVDLVSSALVILVLWAIAQGLVAVILRQIGFTSRHVSQAAGLLALLYLVAIAVTVCRRFYYSVLRDVCPASPSPIAHAVARGEATECSK